MMMGKGGRALGTMAILVGVLVASYVYHQGEAAQLLEIPVTRVAQEEALVTSASGINELEAFRLRRQTRREEDCAALTALAESPHTTKEARQDAEAALLRLVEEGEKEQAAEGAALGAGFAPCLCVVEGEQVTLMVGKQTLTPGEAALLHTIAQTHTGAAPGHIVLLTGSDW